MMWASSDRKREEQLAALLPGGLLHYDYRTACAKAARITDQLRVVQWNIERGMQLDRIVRTLRALQADVLLLQEVEINSPRSGCRNLARELAEALEMQLYFVCEFEEVYTPEHDGRRGSPSAWLQEEQRFFHGNAILSSCATLSDPHVLQLFPSVDWGTEGRKLQRSRQGFRCALRCRIQRYARTSFLLPDLYLYCCHFELDCGALIRVRQLLHIFRDATILLQQQQQQQQHPAFIIGGDFSTMADGTAVFARRAWKDRMCFLGIGEKEACWLERKVLSRRMDRVVRGCCPFSYRFPYYISCILYDRVCKSNLVLRLLYGFSVDEIADMNNHRLCFYDPGDKVLSVTASSVPTYRGLDCGKSDWLLISNMVVVPPELSEEATLGLQRDGSINAETAACLRQQRLPPDGYMLFNERFEASNHKGLALQVRQHIGLPQDTYPELALVQEELPVALALQRLPFDIPSPLLDMGEAIA